MLTGTLELDVGVLAPRVFNDMHARLRERSALAQERFMPVMRGLDLVIAGGRLARWDPDAPRLLGWSTTRPFLFG